MICRTKILQFRFPVGRLNGYYKANFIGGLELIPLSMALNALVKLNLPRAKKYKGEELYAPLLFG